MCCLNIKKKMLHITLFLLILQIGFNSALNIRNHYRSPSARSMHSSHTMQTRQEDPDQSQLSLSQSYESDSDYPSYEEDDLGLLPLRNYWRRKDYFRHVVPDDLTYVANAPHLNKNENSIPSSIQHRRYRNSSPYSKPRAPNLRRYSYSRIKDFLSSIDEGNPKDNLLQLLGSLIRHLGNEDKTRKYNKKEDNLSLEIVSDETTEFDEENDSSLELTPFYKHNSYYKSQEPSYERRNYRKSYNNNNKSNTQIQRTPSAKGTFNEADAILVTGDNKSHNIGLGPKSENSDSITDRRDHPDFNIEGSPNCRKKVKDYHSNNLLLKHLLRKGNHFTNRKIKDSDLSEDLFNANNNMQNDSTANNNKFSKLRMSNLEEYLSQKYGSSNDISTTYFFKHLPSNKLTLDNEVGLNLSDLFSKILDKLNIKSLDLDDIETLYSSKGEPELKTFVDLTHDKDKPFHTNTEETRSFSQDVGLISYDDSPFMKTLLADNTEKILIPCYTLKHHNKHKENKEIGSNEEFSLDSNNVKNAKSHPLFNFNIYFPILESHPGLRMNQNTEELVKKIIYILHLALLSADQVSRETDDITSETLSEIPSIKNDEQKYSAVNLTDTLGPDSNLNLDTETKNKVLRSQKINNFTDEQYLKYTGNAQPNPNTYSNENALRNDVSEDPQDEFTLIKLLKFPWNGEPNLDSENVSNTLQTHHSAEFTGVNLEYPWNDQLHQDKAIVNSFQSQKEKDYIDKLFHEYPWNDQLSPNNANMNTQTTENYIDDLYLEYPWNDQLSAADSKTKALQTQESKDSTDELFHHLEYPWNNQLSPNNTSTNGVFGNQSLNTTTDELHLEFPWNDQLSPDDDNNKNAPQTKNFEDFNNVLHLEYPWNDQPSPEGNKTKLSKPDKENTNEKIVTHSVNTDKKTILRHHNKCPENHGTNFKKRLLAKIFKDLDNKYNKLKKIVLESP